MANPWSPIPVPCFYVPVRASELRRAASVLSGEVGGALPVAAIRALVDVDFAAENVELFGHGGASMGSAKMAENV